MTRVSVTRNDKPQIETDTALPRHVQAQTRKLNRHTERPFYHVSSVGKHVENKVVSKVNAISKVVRYRCLITYNSGVKNRGALRTLMSVLSKALEHL